MNTNTRSALRLLVVLAILLSLLAASPRSLVRADDVVVTNNTDSGEGSLRWAIEQVSEGGTITFDLPAYVTGIILTTGELVIDQDMTILGPGADDLFVSGFYASRVFNITSGAVTISGLTITDGAVVDWNAMGGGICNAGELTLRGMTLRHNQAVGEPGGGHGFGGGIFTTGPLLIEDSLLEDNLAWGGHGSHPEPGGWAYGGAIYVGRNASLTIRRSDLESNRAEGGDYASGAGSAWGGAIFATTKSTVLIQDVRLYDNKSTGGVSSDGTGGEAHAGAIAVRANGSLTIEEGQFYGNTAVGEGDQQPGGAFGGAVDVAATAAMTATNTYFTHSTATAASGDTGPCGLAEGGAIHNAGQVTLLDSYLVLNTAQAAYFGLTGCPAYGGAIFATEDSVTTLEDCEVKGNQAKGGVSPFTHTTGGDAHGGGIHNKGTLTLDNTSITANWAVGGHGGVEGGKAYGGGIHTITPGTLDLRDSILDDNLAQAGAGDASPGGGWAYGGGACLKGPATIERTVLSDNTVAGGNSTDADGGSAQGGGLWLDDALTIQDSTLRGNEALGGDGYGLGGTGSGGGIETGYATTLTIIRSLVADNLAQGGASTASDPGEGLGGGLRTYRGVWDNSHVTVTNSTFSGNEAGSAIVGQGGAIYATEGTTLTLSFCTIVHNEADHEGGGIFSKDDAENVEPAIKNTIVGANTATTGPQLFGPIQSRGYNLVESLQGTTFLTTPDPNTDEGNIIGPPGVGPLQDNGGHTWTHALLGGADPSQAIDSGSPSAVDGSPVNVDQRSLARPWPVGGEHDIGAYERGVSDLSIVKEATPPEVLPGGTVTFTLTIANSGHEPATGVVLSDIIPASLTVTGISSTLDITDTGASPPYVWSVEDLVPGESGAVTLTCELAQDAMPGILNNTATISTTETDADPGDNSDSAWVTIGHAPGSNHRVYLPLIVRE